MGINKQQPEQCVKLQPDNIPYDMEDIQTVCLLRHTETGEQSQKIFSTGEAKLFNLQVVFTGTRDECLNFMYNNK